MGARIRIHPFRLLIVLVAAGVAVVSVRATVLARASGGTATSVQLVSPTAAVPTADGGFLLTDEQKCTVSKVTSGGAITVIAGNGTCGHSGDGAQATSAELDYPTDAVPTSDGGVLIAEAGKPNAITGFGNTVYLGPQGGSYIRKVSSGGTISTVAGDGTLGDTGDGGPATSAEIDALSVVPFSPPGAAVSTSGTGFLISDPYHCVVREVNSVDSGGTITTVAGDANQCPTDNAVVLSRASCFSTSLCAAVGSGLGGQVTGQGYVVTSTDPTAAQPQWLDKPIDGTDDPLGISCPSASLCVVGDNSGNVLTSTDPTDGQSATWAKKSVAGESVDQISCPSTGFCAAIAFDTTNSAWAVYTTKDPQDGASATWATKDIIGSGDVDPDGAALEGISCDSSSFCAATDDNGDVLTSIDPSDGASATWTLKDVDGTNAMSGISCTSTTFCIAGDIGGDLVWSNNPTVASPTWSTETGVSTFVESISCASATLCVMTGNGGVVTSTNPTHASSWTDRGGYSNRQGDVLYASCELTSTMCIGLESQQASNNFAFGSPILLPASIVTTNADAASPSWTLTVMNGDGGSATGAALDQPVSAAPTHDGGFLITQWGGGGDCAIRKVLSGSIATVAGGNGCGYSGDNGPADQAQIGNSTSAVPSTDAGGFLISDYNNNRVREVSGGTITTVAGNGHSGSGGNGGSATSSPLTAPSAAVPVTGGGFLIGSFSGNSKNSALVRDVSPTGTIKTVAGMSGQHFALAVSERGTGAGKVSSSPAGIVCPHTCNVAYPSGTHVTLSAKAANGSVFSGWKGSCSGTKSCSVTMSQARSVTATFNTLAPVCTLVHPSGAVHLTTKTVHGKNVTTGSLALSVRCTRAGKVKLGGVVHELHPAVKRFSIAPNTVSVEAGHVVHVTLGLPSAAVAALQHGAKESAVLTMLASDPKASRSTSATLALSVSHHAANRAGDGSSRGARATASVLALVRAGLVGRGA